MASELKIVGLSYSRPTALDARLFAEFLSPLPGDMPIFHFLPLSYFDLLLRSGELSLKRCDTFADDPDDGRLPERNKVEHSRTVSDLNRNYNQDIKFASPSENYQQAEILRRNTFVHCWFSGRPNNARMWQEYGQQEKGLCIVSTIARLDRAVSRLSAVGQVQIRRAFYSDKSEPITTIPLDVVPFLKHESFTHEKEIRASFVSKGKHESLKYDAASARLSVPIDLLSLIQGVIFGRLTTLEQRELFSTQIKNTLGAKVTIDFHSETVL